MAKIYTPEEIDNINLGGKSVFGATYSDTRGYKFQGVENGRLVLLKQSSQTTYETKNPLDNINTNVQRKVESLESETNKSVINLQVQIDEINTNSETVLKTADDNAIAYSIALGGI